MSDPTSPQDLQEALFTAILDQDDETLSRLCNGYTSAIIESFSTWTRVPEPVRNDAAAVKAWGYCLMTLARLFAEAGINQLMEQLTGSSDNSILRWRDAFSRADRLSQAGEYGASIEALLSIAAEMEGAQGPAVDDYLPKVFGLLGSNFFHLGDSRQALTYTQRALKDCQRSGDLEGVRIYTENLQVLAAAAAAAAKPEDETSARLSRLRAAIARAQDLSDDARFDLSNSILDSLLGDIHETFGAEYRGKIYGLLGLNYFRLKDLERARGFTEKALAECRAIQDLEGVRVYTVNLSLVKS